MTEACEFATAVEKVSRLRVFGFQFRSAKATRLSVSENILYLQDPGDEGLNDLLSDTDMSDGLVPIHLVCNGLYRTQIDAIPDYSSNLSPWTRGIGL